MIRELERRLEELAAAVEQGHQLQGEGLERLTELLGKMTEELTRFRAWEAVLYLFFGRYYFGKADPVGAATHDRDFLAGQRREIAQDEPGAKDIEHLYDVLFTLIRAAQEHSSALLLPDEEEHVM